MEGEAQQVSDHLRILLVEDDPIMQHVFSRMLSSRRNWEVICAESGPEAIEWCEDGGFDLILMDIWMPDMDGITTTRIIRQREETKRRRRTPILALTAMPLPVVRERSAGVHMDDFLAKPIRTHDLISRIDHFTGGDLRA